MHAQAPSYGQEVTGSGNQRFVRCCCLLLREGSCSKLCKCLALPLQHKVTQKSRGVHCRGTALVGNQRANGTGAEV